MSTVIDIHTYIQAPTDIYYERAINLGERGGGVVVHLPHAEDIARSAAAAVADMDSQGVDIRLVAPQPHHLMHYERRLARRWVTNYNTVIAAQCAQAPARLKAVAGLTQVAGESPAGCLEELDRCVELGFVGVLLNPDPGEGDGQTPPLGDDYWYPLYERLQALDMPALVVSAGCQDLRESYSSHFITEADLAVISLVHAPRLFEDFPDLKLIIGYGGGSIPYQIGRWRAHRPDEDFEARLRRLWFDTLVHTPASLKMLLGVCGPDRCMFGSDRPGAATVIDPATGRPADDIAAMIRAIDWLTPEQTDDVFAGNARRVFTRLDGPR